MDGAPLMIRFDNDHHGTLDAEGGRRPPHHRNFDVAEIDDMERRQRVGVAQRRIERPHQPRLLADRRRSLAAADPRRMRAAIERQPEDRRLAPLHRRRMRHAHEAARRPHSLDLAHGRGPLVAHKSRKERDVTPLVKLSDGQKGCVPFSFLVASSIAHVLPINSDRLVTSYKLQPHPRDATQH